MSEEETNEPNEVNADTPVEATVEELPIVDQEEDISSFVSIMPTEIDRAFSQSIRLDSDNVIHEPTCLICSSPYRKDIEGKWTETTNHEAVKELIKGRSSAKISDSIIDNHMRYHYERGIKEHQKVEYLNTLKRTMGASGNLTTLDRIHFAMAAIQERIIEIGGLTPSGDLGEADIDKIKSSELTKLLNTFAKYTKMQSDLMGEMEDKGEMISIPKEAFIDFFNNAMSESKNPVEKDMLNEILTKLATLAKA